MKYLDQKVVNEVTERFKSLKEKIVLKIFTQKVECRFCKETKELIEDISSISNKIKLEVFDFVEDKTEAEKLNIEQIPAIVVMTDKDYGIRFYGIPSGYEFASFIEAIILVSSGQSSLSEDTKKFLDSLTQEINLQVFVTPTCPYCPAAVILAHQMAFYSPKVKATMIEAIEFPHLSQKFNVMGVPKTVVNEKEFLDGAAPENMLIDKIKSVLR